MVKFALGIIAALKAIEACLADVPFAQLMVSGGWEPIADGPRPAVVVRLALPDREQVLVVEVRSSGQPRLIREAVNQLLRYLREFPGAYGVVVAPYISSAAAEICAREGIGYVDLAGNCRLAFDQIYIRREGNPNPFATKRDLRSLYSPKAERVLRVLLANPSRAWRVQSLAAEAEVSIGQAHNVKKLLTDREWVRAEPAGLVLVEPEMLLAEWAVEYDPRRSQSRDYYSLKSVSDVEYDLAETCAARGVRCALTGFSAAARLAPAVRYQRASAYVDGDPDAIAETLSMKRVSTGANMTLLSAYDAGVFYGTKSIGEASDQVMVASPTQVYLDLYKLPGRGEEAANAILEEVIRPLWQRSAQTTPPMPSPRLDQS